MQALPRTSRTGLIDFQRLVEQGTNEISQHWLEAMRAEESLPSKETVEEPLLLDSLPLVLDEILCFVESDDSQIDLDNFKSVNDINGHQFGDYLLVKCAEWLHRELRETDVICRYGGDEFGVILPETTGGEARVMMARVADAFRTFGPRAGAPASFGMSFGLAAHPEDDGTVMRIVKVADERLLMNKHEPTTAFLHPRDSRAVNK